MCEEYAKAIVDVARGILARLEETQGMPYALRRPVAFELATRQVAKKLSPKDEADLLRLGEAREVHPCFVEETLNRQEAVMAVLCYCYQKRPRIAI